MRRDLQDGDGPMFLSLRANELAGFSPLRVEPWPPLNEGEAPPRWTVVADSPGGETYVFAVKPSRVEADTWMLEHQSKKLRTLAERLEAGSKRAESRDSERTKTRDHEPER